MVRLGEDSRSEAINRVSGSGLTKVYNAVITLGVIALATLYHDMHNEVNSLKSSIQSLRANQVCLFCSMPDFGA